MAKNIPTLPKKSPALAKDKDLGNKVTKGKTPKKIVGGPKSSPSMIKKMK